MGAGGDASGPWLTLQHYQEEAVRVQLVGEGHRGALVEEKRPALRTSNDGICSSFMNFNPRPRWCCLYLIAISAHELVVELLPPLKAVGESRLGREGVHGRFKGKWYGANRFHLQERHKRRRSWTRFVCSVRNRTENNNSTVPRGRPRLLFMTTDTFSKRDRDVSLWWPCLSLFSGRVSTSHQGVL